MKSLVRFPLLPTHALGAAARGAVLATLASSFAFAQSPPAPVPNGNPTASAGAADATANADPDPNAASRRPPHPHRQAKRVQPAPPVIPSKPQRAVSVLR